MSMKIFALAILPAVLQAAAAVETLTVAGLSQPVEILRDKWGISHIYARNEADLFFAQGYNVAHDRLFQLELWRRQATGNPGAEGTQAGHRQPPVPVPG
jgi:penicillin amidase